jgi:hypothetical protein
MGASMPALDLQAPAWMLDFSDLESGFPSLFTGIGGGFCRFGLGVWCALRGE